MTFAELPKRGRPRMVPIALPVELPALPILRFKPEMIDAWMLSRLNNRWDGFSPQMWQSKLTGLAASNDFLFITNDACVLLAGMTKHAMTARPVVSEIFLFVRNSEMDKKYTESWVVERGVDDEKNALDLYRYAKEWARSMHAARIIMGTCSDLAPSVLKRMFDGDYMVDVLL